MMIIKGRVRYIMVVCSVNIDTGQVSKKSDNEESICEME